MTPYPTRFHGKLACSMVLSNRIRWRVGTAHGGFDPVTDKRPPSSGKVERTVLGPTPGINNREFRSSGRWGSEHTGDHETATLTATPGGSKYWRGEYISSCKRSDRHNVQHRRQQIGVIRAGLHIGIICAALSCLPGWWTNCPELDSGVWWLSFVCHQLVLGSKSALGLVPEFRGNSLLGGTMSLAIKVAGGIEFALCQNFKLIHS
ncbi:hypothetical protein J6590_011592 [Homalodisca vitripennis]|nr:hypothetical protein J6590_011592 [Homalodisca vitripennis]